MNGSKIPHPLRLVIFFLRITLGLNFFYLGFASIFNAALEGQLRTRSLTDLYGWLKGFAVSNPSHIFFEWAFLIIGACLIAGLLTRFVSIAGIVLVILGFLSGLNHSVLTTSQFVNDELIMVFCLLVFIFSDAGTYLGLDKFMHIHLSSRHKK